MDKRGNCISYMPTIEQEVDVFTGKYARYVPSGRCRQKLGGKLQLNGILVTRAPFRMLIERLYGSGYVNLSQQQDKTLSEQAFWRLGKCTRHGLGTLNGWSACKRQDSDTFRGTTANRLETVIDGSKPPPLFRRLLMCIAPCVLGQEIDWAQLVVCGLALATLPDLLNRSCGIEFQTRVP